MTTSILYLHQAVLVLFFGIIYLVLRTGRLNYEPVIYDEKPKHDLPKREELEKTSIRFTAKYLLGIMNSTVSRDFLRANRRSNIHIYPNDWKQLPIPDVSPEQQAPIIALVDKILAAKRNGFERKVARLEKKLDKQVSDLYGIQNEE